MLKRISKFFVRNRLFVLILILATGLRFAHLDFLPPSLNWDEVSHGYNAYSILKTGKDEWGEFLPTIFRAYGDYKLPVYIYLTAISEAIFGLNALAVRLPSVLAGITTVAFTYLLVNELFGYELRVTGSKKLTRNAITQNKLTALIASLLVAVEPWSLFLSRGAFEANLALAFIVSGVYFFLKGVQNSKFFIHSSALFGLSVWTYNSARIFVPILLFFLMYLYKSEFLKAFRRNRRITIYYLLFTIFFFLPMFWQLINPVGQARYEWVAILDEGTIAQINEARNSSSLSPGLARIAYNKGTFFVSRFVSNWASHFSGDFLFFRSGSHFQFSIPGHGLLYLINAVFLIVGIFYLLKKRTKEAMLLLGWFYFGPIASSLTREAPHVLRAITMLPSPMIISAAGFVAFLNWLKERNKSFTKILVPFYLIVLLFHFENYAQKAVLDYRSKYSWAWQYGYEQVVEFVKENYDKYDKIVVTKKYGEPHEFFLFYWPWDPERYRVDPNLIRFYQSNWYWVDSFDKFYFVNDWQVDEEGTGNYEFKLESKATVDCSADSCLLITSPQNYPDGWNKLETVNFLNNQPAFEIYGN